MQGGVYVGQLIEMYATTIGYWTKPLVAFIAFLCMFGTVTASATAMDASLLRVCPGSSKTAAS